MHPSFPALLNAGLTRILNTVLPFHCALCSMIVTNRGICGPCWSQLTFLGTAACDTCGFPLPVLLERDVEESFGKTVCGACAANPPPFARACSVLAYDDVSRALLFRFKHGRDLSLAPLLGNWLVQKGSPLWAETDLLIPVPLHWTRLFKRRFNQAAVLTQQLAKKTRILTHPLLLKRVKRTLSQGHLNVQNRHENMKSAFAVVEKYSPLLSGARVVLVDDVYTTGATLRACAQTLLKGGASSVTILTLARVVRSETLQARKPPKTHNPVEFRGLFL